MGGSRRHAVEPTNHSAFIRTVRSRHELGMRPYRMALTIPRPGSVIRVMGGITRRKLNSSWVRRHFVRNCQRPWPRYSLLPQEFVQLGGWWSYIWLSTIGNQPSPYWWYDCWLYKIPWEVLQNLVRIVNGRTANRIVYDITSKTKQLEGSSKR